MTRREESSSGIGTNIDIENLKRTEARLRQSEEELQRSQHYLAEAQRLSHIGSWAWSPVSNAILYWSEECYRILGYDPAQGLPSFESSFERIHPEDRPALAETIERAVRERAGFQIDYRLMLPDGTRRSVHIQSQPVLDVSGALVEFIGTVMDVTEQELLTQERRRREAYLAEAQRLSHTGSFGWKPDSGRDHLVSRNLSHLRVRPSGEANNRFSGATRSSRGSGRLSDGHRTCLCGGTQFEHTYRLLLPDGRVKHVHALAHATQDASGNREFVGAVTDMTDRQASRRIAPRKRGVPGGGAETQPDRQLGLESRPGYQVLVGGMLPCSEFRSTGWFAPIRRILSADSSRRPTRLQGTNPDGYPREDRVGGGLPHRASGWPRQGHSRRRSSCSEHVRPSR